MWVRGGGPVALSGRIDRRHRIAGALALALCATGCGSTGPTLNPSAAVRGTTISFESIEGPPPAVAQRIVRSLSEEMGARQVVVVPAGGQAQYRIRGYLAAQPTSIAWAWDVYDGAQQRAFRLRGEEQAAGRAAWTGADEAVLRRIARSSVEQFAALVSAPRSAPSPETPQPTWGWGLIAAFDDFRPEAAGIVRVLRPGPAPMALGAAPEAAAPDIPLPRIRPAPEATSAMAFDAQ